MGVVYLDVCPKCRKDVSRRLGFITEPVIACLKCGTGMRVTRPAVVNNWQYNFAMWSALIAWAISMAAFLALAPPPPQAPGGGPASALGVYAGIAIAGFFFALLFVGLPCALIGRLIGYSMARKLDAPDPGRS